VAYYTITITGTPHTENRTTMRVDTSGTTPRITEVAVQNDDELTALAPIDLNLLIQALFPCCTNDPSERTHPLPPSGADRHPSTGSRPVRRHRSTRPPSRMQQSVARYTAPGAGGSERPAC
jgi:hypothetical protein